MSRRRGRRAGQGPARPSSLVPAQVPRPATILYRVGRRRTRVPGLPPASCRRCGHQGRTVAAARSSRAPGSARLPATTRCSSRAGQAVLGRPPSRPPAEDRPPARLRCSAGSGRTGRPPGDRRAARPRRGLYCRTGRQRTAPDPPPGRMARPWAPVPGRTVPGRPARVLVRGRTGQVLAARRRTGLARTRQARGRGLPVRIPAGQTATAAPDHSRPAQAAVPVRRPASPDRTGRARRPDPGQAVRLLVALVPRRAATPGRTGIPAPAHSAPWAAIRARAPRTAGPGGPVPARGSSVPDTPVAAGSPGIPVPGSPRVAVDTPARARRPGPGNRPARPDPARAAAGRRIPRGADREGAPGAAGPGAADPGEPAVDEGLPGADGAAPRLASRPRDAAKAGRPIRDRALPASPNVAGTRAWAACRAPAGPATVLAACPRDAAARAPGRSRSPGNQGQRDRRRPPGRSPAGKRPCWRRRRRRLHRACLGQARCPDDSPGTSWTQRCGARYPD